MNKQLSTTTSITLNADKTRVWSALTDPEQIKQYFYGTQTETDWKVGSPIRFTGDWEGTPYVDKGEVLTFEPEQRLQYSYLSSFTGLEDKPENYSIVTFEVTADGTGTKLTVNQSNFKDETHRDHSKANWDNVLVELRKLLETE